MNAAVVGYCEEEEEEKEEVGQGEKDDKKGRRFSSVSCCFEPSQALGITSGLKTKFNPSLSYSAHKSLNVDQNFCTTQNISHKNYTTTHFQNSSHKCY